MTGARKHVLLLSFPAYGHLIPLLELGKKISKYHHVSLVLANSRITELRKRELFADDPKHNMDLIGIEDVEYIEQFDKAGDPSGLFETMLKFIIPGYRKFMESLFTGSNGIFLCRPIDIAIADCFLGSPMLVCHHHGIPFYLFYTANSGSTLAFLMASEKDPVCARYEDMDPFMRPPKPGFDPQPNLASFQAQILELQTILPLARGIIVNSFRAIEKDTLAVLDTMPAMKGLTVSCVGPLMPDESHETSTNIVMEKRVKKWLDNKHDRSVLYISFGSIAMPAPEQLKELGGSLLLLNKPFILSLRAEFLIHLPTELRHDIDKYHEAEDGRFLILPWLPQKTILTHRATRVFLSHCGWNSTLESLFGGVPVVAWPMFADQLVNGEWLADHGLGRVIQGTGVKPQRVVPAEEIKEVIVDVAGWGKDDTVVTSYLTAAQFWQKQIVAATVPNGSSQNELLELVNFQPART